MKKAVKNTGSKPPAKSMKLLIPLFGDDVAPRFDLSAEALIAVLGPGGELVEERTIILSEASAEALCHLILTEKVDTVVCCGIEDEYYQYLTWKQVKVFDSVMGPYVVVLERVRKGAIRNGDILINRSLGHSSDS